MVNRDPSKGCHTCKSRRVKCDEGKPVCNECLRLGRECGGYDPKPVQLKFKVQTVNCSPKPRRKATCKAVTTTTAATGHSCISPALQQPQRDAALAFFLGHFAGMGRNLASTRGFFEVLAPVLASQRTTSAVYTAVTAVATRLFAMWRNDDINFALPHQPYVEALARLREALKDPDERNSYATTLAALVLQFYENLFAVHSLRKATRTHHDGAVVLFMSQE